MLVARAPREVLASGLCRCRSREYAREQRLMSRDRDRRGLWFVDWDWDSGLPTERRAGLRG